MQGYNIPNQYQLLFSDKDHCGQNSDGSQICNLSYHTETILSTDGRQQRYNIKQLHFFYHRLKTKSKSNKQLLFMQKKQNNLLVTLGPLVLKRTRLQFSKYILPLYCAQNHCVKISKDCAWNPLCLQTITQDNRKNFVVVSREVKSLVCLLWPLILQINFK